MSCSLLARRQLILPPSSGGRYSGRNAAARIAHLDPRRSFLSASTEASTAGSGDRRRRTHEEEAMKLSAAAALLALTATSHVVVRPARSFSLSMSARSRAAASPPGTDAVNGDRARHPLEPLGRNLDNSWLRHLSPEDEANRLRSSGRARGSGDEDRANRCSRPVFNGHYVEVAPTPLRNPRLVAYSSDLAARLGLTEEDVRTEEFAKFFSGDVEGAFASNRRGERDEDTVGAAAAADVRTWATPYALSIMGTRYTNNCPYGTGDGYGDGRAISVGEVSVPPSEAERPASPRYELQLKGAGRTPFCRGADGRAVLRSSVREFLASEAMHHLGVRTTRALSLVVSDGPDGDTSARPWYSDDSQRVLPGRDDPRLARYTDAQRRQILATLAAQSRGNPDVMITEPNAITCRVAPSFVRVGHLDLFARRATAGASGSGGGGKSPRYDASTAEWDELERMIWHAAYREFPEAAYDPYRDDGDVVGAARALLEESMDAISTMVAEWIRVGFSQGNFNADNCLVGGRTMDYGPFGFVDEYHPLYAKWTGSGEHFGFLNQPSAGYANYAVLVESVIPVVYEKLGEAEGDRIKEDILGRAQRTFQRKFDAVFRTKLGFPEDDESADEVWREAEPLLRECRADWTLFWRQLTEVARRFPVSGGGGEEKDPPSEAYGDMLDALCGSDEVREGSSPFHEPLDSEYRARFLRWIQKWRETLVASAAARTEEATPPEERMRRANPKYVLREWMLAEAYTRAAGGDESMIGELLELSRRPYDEGTEEQEGRYYRRAPDEALRAGGIAYMS